MVQRASLSLRSNYFSGAVLAPRNQLEDKDMADNQGGGGADKLIYFLVGAGIGAITALLFAPKTGSELRSEIADATRKGLDYARDTGREIGERASDYYQTGVERASDLTTRGKEAVSDLTDRGKDLISRQKGQFAAAIEAGKQGYREAKQADRGRTGGGKTSAAVEES
jgi:gas vesicle protein